jgi:hypothetical protein
MGAIVDLQSIELIARTAFVLSVSRTIELNPLTESQAAYHIHRTLTVGSENIVRTLRKSWTRGAQ